jgi:hypothetical protein
MPENDTPDLVGRLPKLDDLSLHQVLTLRRTVLADVILDRIGDPNTSPGDTADLLRVAAFQNYTWF